MVHREAIYLNTTNLNQIEAYLEYCYSLKAVFNRTGQSRSQQVG